ncbi:MAG: sodium:solute symporter [candidate division KSB1 bacterium]|nr:sodium:solute symporter [candidate division KSB1 bacterium]
MGSALGWIDLTVVAGYFIIILGLAWWVIRQRQNTTTDYFLAGRHLGWFIIGASIFASNIGSEHLVGLAGSGCTDGVALDPYDLHALFLLVLAWVMVPFYMRSKVFTMPEFLERRFSPTARTVLSVISLVAYVLTKIAVGIFAGGVVFSVLLPDVNFMGLDSFWVGSILVIVLTGIYTILGGLRAVAYTEALQTIILIIGSMLVTVFGLKAIGGWSELRAVAGSEMFNLWKPLVPDGLAGTWAPVKESTRMAWYFNDNYPWLGMLFCAPIIGLWYWCTDQYIVQRALGAPNEREARRGSIWAAYLKLLPVFIFIIPGIISFALAKSGKVAAIQQVFFDGSGNLLRDRAQEAFPLLVAHVLPVGVRGIVVAGLLAALMSSLAGVFNASSTLFTMDFYSRLRPQSTQQHLVWVGRLATAVMVLIGLLWIPVIRGGKGLYDYLQGVQSYLAPPIFVVFFFGVFMKRLNAKGCLAALITGFLLGLFRMAVDTPVKLIGNFQYEYGSFLWIVNHIYFQYYSLLIFIISIIIMIVVSYLTEEPSYDRITGLTFSTMTEEHRRQTRESWNYKDVVYSMIVLALILAAYLYFTG